MLFYLTTKALEDFKEIGRYTQKTWGIKQRNFYLKQIDDVFYFIAEFPNRGQRCNDIRKGYLKYSAGKHIIFYRQIQEEIQIVRILHTSMNISNHL